MIMKKFGDKNNVTTEQEYSGLTITELENKLITEQPENGINIVFRALSRWGRLLVALCLVLILIYGIFYIQSLKKEIEGLRRELNSRSGNTSQAENTGLSLPADNTTPGVPGLPVQNEFVFYHVQRGDTLSTISSAYFDSEEFAPYLAELNNIPADSQLNVGQEIKVPIKPYESWSAGDM